MAAPDITGLPTSRKAAKATGSVFYFTGEPCPNGHLAPRYTSARTCRGCSSDVAAARALATKVRRTCRILSPRQQALADGKPRYRTGVACPRGHNVERVSANGVCVACGRDNRLRCEAENPERAAKRKTYMKDNAERYRIHNQNRRAKRTGNQGTHTKEDVAAILVAQRGRCAYCREPIKKWHVDHIKPILMGGSNGRSNLQLTCASCNLRKSWKDPIAFAQEMGLLV